MRITLSSFLLVFPVGVSRTRFRGQNLPIDLTPLGAPGCSLLQSWTSRYR